MEQSLEQKQSFLSEKLAPWADRLLPVRSVPQGRRLHYRDKVKLSARCYGGRWEFGMEPRDEFIPIPRCPVQTERVRLTLEALGRHLPPFEKLPLRYVVQNGALVTLVVKAPALISENWVTEELRTDLANADASGLHVNLHPAAGRILFAEKGWRCLWGQSRARDARGLWHGPGVFGQLLPELHEESLSEAQTFFQLTPASALVDLYCGIGTSLRRWSSISSRILGVEFDGQAVECARSNAPEASILRGPCAQRLPQVRAWLSGQGGALHAAYVNPPRTGLEEEVLQWLGRESRPARIAYLSCSAGTLRRDLELFSSQGYEVASLLPYDFFPQTHHVEVLALLERK